MTRIILQSESEKLKKFNENLKWFQAHYEELTDHYGGEYVAIHNNQPVDHDRDVYTLMKRLKREYGDLSPIVIERVRAQYTSYAI